MIVGHDLLKENCDVNITFGGPRCSLTVCNPALANLDRIPLFSNLSTNCKPIAVRSRRYSPEHSKFIKEGIQRLLEENTHSRRRKKYTASEACGNLYRRILFGVTNEVAGFQRTIHKIIEEEGSEDTFAYLDDVTICGTDESHYDHNLQLFKKTAEKNNSTLNEEKCVSATDNIKVLGYSIGKKTIKPEPDKLKPLLEILIPNNISILRRTMGMFAHSKWTPKFSEKIQPLVEC
ncbi:hypothetical protein JTB14_029808 [Gonioctena quinquepunctata]|nr:hypothetical protein JTB14_029808 [Gonioctena quinquepunctata]